jgi:hypothetical protein
VKVALQARQLLERPAHIGCLGLDFLHTNTIRRGFAIQASTPLVAAERMPLRLRLVNLNKEFPMVVDAVHT